MADIARQLVDRKVLMVSSVSMLDTLLSDCRLRSMHGGWVGRIGDSYLAEELSCTYNLNRRYYHNELPSHSKPYRQPNCSQACIKISRLANSRSWICCLPRQRKLFNLSISVLRQRSFSAFDARSSLKPPSAAVKEVFTEGDRQNLAISSLYRCSEIPRPNQIVLDAQAKVCTGPEQTRPLTEEQAMIVLDTILKSG
ncbi:hypothetical protein KSP40_PGU016415 [Platanthera guangdongensis]|uniref:Uncharacterized protein n=1 Tax=Platanthera guangdongensis TaxID=2320717 RepID=A0ABR2M872_9ASPA